MTDEEWKIAEDKLSGLYGYVRLKIDGYNVTVEKRQMNEMQFCLAVFIDGTFKMKWALEDCEIRRRFCREVKKRTFTSRSKADFVKAVGKKAAKQFEKENSHLLYSTYYEPFFGSFRTLKAHLIRNNDSIELRGDPHEP